MIRDDKIESLIKYIKAECKKHKVKCHLSNAEYVKWGSMKVNGYFVESNSDKHNAILAVSMKKSVDKWLVTLIHEFCHMQQWIEQCKEWKDVDKYSIKDGLDVMDEWIMGKEYSKSVLDKAIHSSLMVELDCEKRVIKMIKEFDIDIDPIKYTQQANSYVLFYKIIRKYRKWYKINREPYNTESVWTRMPKSFKSNIYDKPLSPKHEEILMTCYS